jgi:hypothetical protein
MAHPANEKCRLVLFPSHRNCVSTAGQWMNLNLTAFGARRTRLTIVLGPMARKCRSSDHQIIRSSDHDVDAVAPMCSAWIGQPPNPMKVGTALIHWSRPSARHNAETRLCISLPFSISFIANIAGKRPELNRDKTSSTLECNRSLLSGCFEAGIATEDDENVVFSLHLTSLETHMRRRRASDA